MKQNRLGKLGLEATKNLYGYMHSHMSPIGSALVSYSKTNLKKPMLDIGCAYGVTTIPCLENGAKVIACDIEPLHLEELKRRVPSAYLDALSLRCSHFPNDLELESGSISAALLSHVLSFLTKEEIELGFSKLSKWLGEGGKLFILNYTPYHKGLSSFIPDYERRLKTKKIFAGEILDKSKYCEDKLINSAVPNRLMLFDKETLLFLLTENGFEVEYLDYLGGEDSGVPKPFCLDGREWIGCIGIKKF